MAKRDKSTSTDEAQLVINTDTQAPEIIPAEPEAAPAAEAPAEVDQVEAPSSQPKPIKPGVRRISLAQARKHHGMA